MMIIGDDTLVSLGHTELTEACIRLIYATEAS